VHYYYQTIVASCDVLLFQVSCKDENLVLFSENKETVVEWMKAFQDAIG
jgi:hypothetical protein